MMKLLCSKVGSKRFFGGAEKAEEYASRFNGDTRPPLAAIAAHTAQLARGLACPRLDDVLAVDSFCGVAHVAQPIDWDLGAVTAMTVAEFKAWLKDGDTTVPVAKLAKDFTQSASPTSGITAYRNSDRRKRKKVRLLPSVA
jgi:hypothetical protein